MTEAITIEDQIFSVEQAAADLCRRSVLSAQAAADGGGLDHTLWDLAEGCQEAAVTLRGILERDLRAARKRKQVIASAQRRIVRRIITVMIAAFLLLAGAAFLIGRV